MANFGLIGSRLDYSFSKTYFEQKFKDIHTYINMEMQDLSALKSLLETNEIVGFNVTIPFKENIIPFLDALSPEAQKIGAVNTVKKEGGKWIGYNTDHYGFRRASAPFLEDRQKVLILGDGGAAKAVRYALEEIGKEVFIASRNPEGRAIPYSTLNEENIAFFEMIINTTPLGSVSFPNERPNIPYNGIQSRHFCMDLIYKPEKTLFLQSCEAQGASISNGYNMLVHQAEKAYEIWGIQ